MLKEYVIDLREYDGKLRELISTGRLYGHTLNWREGKFDDERTKSWRMGWAQRRND